MSILRRGLIIASVLISTPFRLEAQQSQCSYETCALRIEDGQLLEGAIGTPVGKIGLYYSDLRILQAGPASAVQALAASRRQARTGRLLAFGGLALAAVATVTGPTGSDALNDGPTLMLYGSSLALSQWAMSRMRRSQSELGAAIWHYNEAAAAGMVRPDPGLIPLRPAHYGHLGGFIGGAAGVGIGLLATSGMSWNDAAKAISITAGAGLAGGAIGWSIGARRHRQ